MEMETGVLECIGRMSFSGVLQRVASGERFKSRGRNSAKSLNGLNQNLTSSKFNNLQFAIDLCKHTLSEKISIPSHIHCNFPDVFTV
jgi:hypothetical protein